MSTSSRASDERRVEALAIELNSAAIHLLRRIRESDAQLGVSPSRLSALSVVVFAGPLSLGALASAEQVTPPTMSRLVDALASAGLVTRRPAADPQKKSRVPGPGSTTKHELPATYGVAAGAGGSCTSTTSLVPSSLNTRARR